LGQSPGVATSSELPSGSRKYRLVPPRAQWIRTILFELSRIANVGLYRLVLRPFQEQPTDDADGRKPTATLERAGA
jgi:hypothetical protein